jgi:hypothetical protein
MQRVDEVPNWNSNHEVEEFSACELDEENHQADENDEACDDPFDVAVCEKHAHVDCSVSEWLSVPGSAEPSVN